MKTTTYTPEEEKLINHIENENPQSIPNLEDEIDAITQIVKENVQKRKQINFLSSATLPKVQFYTIP